MPQPKSSDDARLSQLRELLGQAVVIPTERLQAVLDDARRGGHIDTKGVDEIVGGLLRQAEDVRSQIESILGAAGAAVGRAQEAGRAASEPLLRAVGRGSKGDDTPSTVGGGGAGAKSRQAVAKASRSKASGASSSTTAASPKGTPAKASSSKAKPKPKPKSSKASTSKATTSKASSPGGSTLPIKDYDDLKAADVTKKLDGLSAADLRKVRKHEADGKSRKGVLQAIDRKLT